MGEDARDDHTPKYGLAVLSWLGIERLSAGEERIFQDTWGEVYQATGRNLIKTMTQIYAERLACQDGTLFGGTGLLRKLTLSMNLELKASQLGLEEDELKRGLEDMTLQPEIPPYSSPQPTSLAYPY